MFELCSVPLKEGKQSCCFLADETLKFNFTIIKSCQAWSFIKTWNNNILNNPNAVEFNAIDKIIYVQIYKNKKLIGFNMKKCVHG